MCSLLVFVFSDVFLTQFSALQTSRSVRTRRLAAAEENTEVTRTARLAHIFKEIWDMITSYKGSFPTLTGHAARAVPRRIAKRVTVNSPVGFMT